MGSRMFAAVYPPEDVREELAEFLEARPGMRWAAPEQMHLTLAFLAAVPERSVEPMVERMAEACTTMPSFLCGLHGAGAFPHPDRPAVLWLGVEDGSEELTRLSRRIRNAANRAGVAPDGTTFVPHLTLARPDRGANATRWIRVLETVTSRMWEVTEVHVVESVLQASAGGRRHRPRHETVAVLPLTG